jgi:tripartite-type tricarboxylate transporter receptor subunit TctC
MKVSAPRIRVFIVALALFAGAALAQNAPYPSRPVKIIVPSAPGGGTDIIARELAAHFSKSMGQSFVVENKAGAGNMIGIEAAARSAPDGYTLLFVPSPLVLNTVLYKSVPYKPVLDFAPITIAATAPNVLVAGPAVTARTLSELIALAKQKPGAISYGSAGVGTSPHMSMELFKSMAGVDLLHVPYKGTTPAVTDLLGGQIGVMFVNALTAKPHIDSGRLRALAVSGTKRIEALPNLPTVAEAGVPGYVSLQWYGLLAPADTPPNVIARLNVESYKALKTDAIKQKLAADGAEPVGSSPGAFATLIREELEKWTKVAQTAKIEPQ